MRLIGLLGGMSWVSSAEYYRLLNQGVRDRLGGLHAARCLLYSVDMAEIERLQIEDRWEDAAILLSDAARALEVAGAEVLLLCTNTMHRVADEIQASIGIPLLHLADVAASAVNAAGLKRVGLLGTGYVMEQRFYRDRLESHGLQVIVPDAADRAVVHRTIFEELAKNIVSNQSRDAFAEIIGRLASAGAEGVILGCTELELLVGPEVTPLPLFATARLHVEAAIAAALAE